MDQDFHYYGTYYAARTSGSFTPDQARLIALSANFIDFLNESTYAGYWKLVDEANAEVATLRAPRYTFQGNLSGTGLSPEDGLWASYHFTPGNHALPDGTPSLAEVHGARVAERLPEHVVREISDFIDARHHTSLNRPLSALSRALVIDAIGCATTPADLERILEHTVGGTAILESGERAALLERFRLILLGVRAHVIADTWAHQDWSAANDKLNTYWDVNGASLGRQSIDYQDEGDTWHNVVLSATKSDTFKAVPNGTSYIGHGWMGHFPDYSFVKYRYKPCWRPADAEPFVRDNPTEYRHAFLELTSLFAQAGAGALDPGAVEASLAASSRAISTPCNLRASGACARHHSAERWVAELGALYEVPKTCIDTRVEPDPAAVLPGLIAKPSGLSGATRYGTFTVGATSDLYLFQIAADYHFRFVRHWLEVNGIQTFTGSWSKQAGPVSPEFDRFFPAALDSLV